MKKEEKQPESDIVKTGGSPITPTTDGQAYVISTLADTAEIPSALVNSEAGQEIIKNMVEVGRAQEQLHEAQNQKIEDEINSMFQGSSLFAGQGPAFLAVIKDVKQKHKIEAPAEDLKGPNCKVIKGFLNNVQAYKKAVDSKSDTIENGVKLYSVKDDILAYLQLYINGELGDELAVPERNLFFVTIFDETGKTPFEQLLEIDDLVKDKKVKQFIIQGYASFKNQPAVSAAQDNLRKKQEALIESTNACRTCIVC